MSLEEVEAFLIKKALARAGGNARQAAEALGLSRSAFYRRLQQYGLWIARGVPCRLRDGWPATRASRHTRKARALRRIEHEAPKARRRISHENRLTWLTIGAVAPAAIVALCLLWFGDYSAKVQWTLTLVIVGFALGYIVSTREQAIRPWQTVTNLLAALREGDYSIRARGARENDALGEALLEVNELGETLRVQRLGAFEATALFRTIMAEIDVAVFTFDPERSCVSLIAPEKIC